ncbi:MAG: bacillithiol biosynthesis cysteine-adding enzyme BshC [Bacteroidetes bacterium]|nr:bacillithiol biosynthesis cysteine-adding enzyme BshC [Bacteroidota bacterium]
MRHVKLPLSETESFSGFFLDYIGQKENLKPFYNRFPSIESFKEQIAEKQSAYTGASRKLLVEVLKEQYKTIPSIQAVTENIEALEHTDTFTVTTGHQLNIFSGPLYFIYKIVTTINACLALKKKYPAHRFVPVYWMASEDHDFEEIRYFSLEGKKFSWTTDQKGAVGRFNLKDMASLLNEVPSSAEVFIQAYKSSSTLAEAVRKYVHALFGDHGLVVMDGDHPKLKGALREVMRSDIIASNTIEEVTKTNKALSDAGYEPQIFVRETNFFFLEAGLRERIQKTGERFQVNNTNYSFDEAAIKKLIEEQPEKFSPNVVLRPLYQEILLPNLAYVGGPAENIYWLQLKGVFDFHKTVFPILLPRNFALVARPHETRLFDQSGIVIKDLFLKEHILSREIAIKNSASDLKLQQEFETLNQLFDQLTQSAKEIDPTLEKHIQAQKKKTTDRLTGISVKMIRAEKRKHEDRIRQTLKIKQTLFPGGGLQERVDNLLRFYPENRDFIQDLTRYFDPFDFRFNVLMYE